MLKTNEWLELSNCFGIDPQADISSLHLSATGPCVSMKKHKYSFSNQVPGMLA